MVNPRIPREGDWVAFVLKSGKSIGKVRYGFIVGIYESSANLLVFTNGLEDFEHGEPGSNGILWVEDVLYSQREDGDDGEIKGTWHWPEE